MQERIENKSVIWTRGESELKRFHERKGKGMFAPNFCKILTYFIPTIVKYAIDQST